MSKISLLTIFLSVAFAEANNCSSGCDEYLVNSCESGVTGLFIDFPEVTVSGCRGDYKKTLFPKPISVRADIASTDEKKNFTLIMVDPNAPGHGKGESWLHWIIANIPGERLKMSVEPSKHSPVLKKYAPPTPPDCDHRYFFLLYIETDSNKMNLADVGKRGRFDLDTFVRSQHLCGPVAVSSFVTQPEV